MRVITFHCPLFFPAPAQPSPSKAEDIVSSEAETEVELETEEPDVTQPDIAVVETEVENSDQGE